MSEEENKNVSQAKTYSIITAVLVLIRTIVDIFFK